MALEIRFADFADYYDAISFKGDTIEARLLGQVFDDLCKSSTVSEIEITRQFNLCCGFSDKIENVNNFKSGGSHEKYYWRFLFFLHVENAFKNRVEKFDREHLKGKMTFGEFLDEPHAFVDLRKLPERGLLVDHSTCTNSDEIGEDETYDTSNLDLSSPAIGHTDFLHEFGPWRLKFHSQVPDQEDHSFLHLEAAGPNFNEEGYFGVFVSASLKERGDSSGFVVGFTAVHIAVDVLGDVPSIISFNRRLNASSAIADAEILINGVGPKSTINIYKEREILRGQYACSEIALMLRPEQKKFEINAYLYVLPTDEVLIREDGSRLNSKIKETIISALIEKKVHPLDREDGRLHLLRQKYEAHFARFQENER